MANQELRKRLDPPSFFAQEVEENYENVCWLGDTC
jgi:hypothetical protein